MSQVNVNAPEPEPWPGRDENAATAATRNLTWAIAMVIVFAVPAIAIVYVLHSLRVVGVFADGPLAGRMRVQGAYALTDPKTGPRVGTAVFAIPRGAGLRRHQSDGDDLLGSGLVGRLGQS